MSGKGWILVVEDTDDLALMVKEGLEREGYRVQTANHPSDAVAKLARQRFHCIILDIRLARGGDGEEVIEAIRSPDTANQNFESPIVVTSGYLSADLVNSLKTEVEHFLVKPFEFSKLLEAMVTVMDQAAKNPRSRAAALRKLRAPKSKKAA